MSSVRTSGWRHSRAVAATQFVVVDRHIIARRKRALKRLQQLSKPYWIDGFRASSPPCRTVWLGVHRAARQTLRVRALVEATTEGLNASGCLAPEADRAS